MSKWGGPEEDGRGGGTPGGVPLPWNWPLEASSQVGGL